MRMLIACAAVVLMTVGAQAEDAKSGLEVGAKIGAFDVVKVAGATEDGVKAGAQLCYRCRYGQRPQVMIFTRSTDENVASLAKQLNELVSQNTEKKLAAFVNVMGENREKLEATAKSFGEDNKLSMVPVVVPVEFENGPANYGISPKAELTVLICNKSAVVANHSFTKEQLSKDSISKVVKQVTEALK